MSNKFTRFFPYLTEKTYHGKHLNLYGFTLDIKMTPEMPAETFAYLFHQN
jgi:hypothetical protein